MISDIDTTFKFFVSIMYSRSFDLICDKVDDVRWNHLRFLINELSEVGLNQKIGKLIATILSR